MSRSRTSSSGGVLVVLTGPSGAGKSTLVARARARLDNVGFSVSYTTRPPREGEQEGVHYHFVDAARFDALEAEGAFLESAIVHGNRYGTHRGQVEAAVARGEIILLDVDVQGARTVRATGVDAAYIFILPPSVDHLSRRLRSRGTDTEDVIAGRLAIAESEMAEAHTFDHRVLNDDLDRAADEFVAILRREADRRID